MADVTPPLDDFLREFEADNNTWWFTDCGDHLNLFEAAVERMQQAERLLSRLIIPSEAFVVPETPPCVRHNRQPCWSCLKDQPVVPATSEGTYDPDLQEARIHQVLGEDELHD